jgi:hypothetical protein
LSKEPMVIGDQDSYRSVIIRGWGHDCPLLS